MRKIVIITGANRGLGKAMVDYIIEQDNSLVVSLSRSINKDHINLEKEKFIFLNIDLSHKYSVSLFNVLNKLITPNTKIYFINNASIILPIGKIGDFEQEDIATSLQVNIEFPVNFINSISKFYFKNEISFVNITSGAAKNPVPYWSLYGSSKAYMNMFFKTLGEELKENKNIKFFSFDPGVLDTDMQRQIREKNAPKQDYFKSLKEENKLINPFDAAEIIFNKINF